MINNKVRSHFIVKNILETRFLLYRNKIRVHSIFSQPSYGNSLDCDVLHVIVVAESN